MTLVADRYIVAESLSEGWLDAVRSLIKLPKKKAIHRTRSGSGFAGGIRALVA
jgi:hypothetical protein